MRRLEHIRTAIALLLLSVVLPMTVVVPFHHHDPPAQEERSCDLCAHHQPHPAHLSASDQPDHCLICQFLGASYLPEQSAAVPAFLPDGSGLLSVPAQDVLPVVLEFHCSRAPPYSFC